MATLWVHVDGETGDNAYLLGTLQVNFTTPRCLNHRIMSYCRTPSPGRDLSCHDSSMKNGGRR